MGEPKSFEKSKTPEHASASLHEDAAALRIQTQWRRLRAEKLLDFECAVVSLVTLREFAAVWIQKNWKAYKVRKTVRQNREFVVLKYPHIPRMSKVEIRSAITEPPWMVPLRMTFCPFFHCWKFSLVRKENFPRINIFEFKFVIDGKIWRESRDYPIVADRSGNINNFIRPGTYASGPFCLMKNHVVNHFPNFEKNNNYIMEDSSHNNNTVSSKSSSNCRLELNGEAPRSPGDSFFNDFSNGKLLVKKANSFSSIRAKRTGNNQPRVFLDLEYPVDNHDRSKTDSSCILEQEDEPLQSRPGWATRKSEPRSESGSKPRTFMPADQSTDAGKKRMRSKTRNSLNSQVPKDQSTRENPLVTDWVQRANFSSQT